MYGENIKYLKKYFAGSPRLCGYSFPTTPVAGIPSAIYPFEMIVHTDNNEQNGEVGYQGFAMTYTQSLC